MKLGRPGGHVAKRLDAMVWERDDTCERYSGARLYRELVADGKRSIAERLYWMDCPASFIWRGNLYTRVQ